MSRVAVITVAHGRHAHLMGQRATLAACTPAPDDHVVVAMDDPELVERGIATVAVEATPAGLPLAAARNRGAEVAIERGADVLVFLDVDCLASCELVEAYAQAVRREPDVVWSGPVTYLETPPAAGYDLGSLAELDDPHPARPAPVPGEVLRHADPDLFWSLSFALSADAWQQVGGFCEEYVGYGGEDTDFARLVVKEGLEMAWLGSARAYHQWHPVASPPVEHLDDIVRNANLFSARWGETPMQGWLDEFEARGLARRGADGRWQVVTPAEAGPTLVPGTLPLVGPLLRAVGAAGAGSRAAAGAPLP